MSVKETVFTKLFTILLGLILSVDAALLFSAALIVMLFGVWGEPIGEWAPFCWIVFSYHFAALVIKAAVEIRKYIIRRSHRRIGLIPPEDICRLMKGAAR